MFRFSARVVAEHMGIFGYAKNESDGTVRIEAEGEEEKLEKFIAWCRRGPEDAEVEKIDVSYSKELKNFETFESIRTIPAC